MGTWESLGLIRTFKICAFLLPILKIKLVFFSVRFLH